MRSSHRSGFATPIVLLAIAVITIALAAAFALVSTERRSVDDQQSAVRALGIAQQGIEAYLRHPENPAFRPGRTVHLPPNDNDTAWVPVGTGGDMAMIIPRLYRVSTLASVDTTYVLSSRGTQGTNGVKGTPPAVRTVAEIARWAGATVAVKAGWLSLSGIDKNGGSGTLSGNDASSPHCQLPPSVTGSAAAGGDVAGVSVPTTVPNPRGGTMPGYTGSTKPLSGTPPLDTTSLGGTPQAAGDSLAKTGMPWAEWSRGLNLPNVWRTADHGGAFPSFADTTYYPIVYVDGDLPKLPDGRGLLVVSGSLTMDGLTHWDGILLVGGTVVANGNDNVDGAVLSGLNLMLNPTPVAPASLGNGNKVIQYNSCQVKKALAGTRALVPRRGTWMDNWRTY